MTTKTLCFLSFLLAFLTACQPDSSPQTVAAPVTPTSVTPPPASSEVLEPLFVQEGVLEFRAPDGTRSLLDLKIEIATLDTEQQQGLMWRKKMQEDQGMLFVFDDQQPRSFWMHNTYIPLDIIYVDASFKVVSIRKNTPILSDTPQPSGLPAQYVIEVNAGVADKYKIAPGTKVAWLDFATQQTLGGFEVAPL